MFMLNGGVDDSSNGGRWRCGVVESSDGGMVELSNRGIVDR